MDEAVIEDLLRRKLSKRELYVIMAMQLGYLDMYDIQRVTGLRREVVIETAQNMQSIYKYIPGNNTNTLVLSAQNVQTGIKTPPAELLAYLNDRLGVHTSNYGRDLRIMKETYIVAYESVKRNQVQAVQLVRDCIDVNLEVIKRSTVPTAYLLAVFKSYVRSIPEMPVSVWERAQAKQVRYRYNNIARTWEET